MFLTKRQKEILDYLRGYISRHGYAPTFDEIAVSFGFTSKGTVYKHIRALKEKRAIRHEWNRTRSIELRPDDSNYNALEVLGTVAAGKPIEAITNPDAIDVPASFLRRGKHYVLKVSGDSMIEAGINDGDTVILKRTDVADNGKIVVALVDDHEAMLKRIRRKGKTVALESANRNYETKIFGPDRVKIQGVLVSLYRNF